VGFAIFNLFNLLTAPIRGFLLTRPEINFISTFYLKNGIFCNNIDGFVKNPKRASFQISHLIISIGYGIEI
jgi:hypothetical protein